MRDDIARRAPRIIARHLKPASFAKTKFSGTWWHLNTGAIFHALSRMPTSMRSHLKVTCLREC
eukprot:1161254-Pelagomonas_calceolata.AAC.3